MARFTEKCSGIISHIFSPIVALFSFFIYDCIGHLGCVESIREVSTVLILIVIPIIVWITWNIRRGKYQDADVSNRKQRASLYFFIEACIILYLCFEYFFYNHFYPPMFFVLLLLTALHISNYMIKSSMHTAFNILAATFFLWRDASLGLLWFCIAIIVGITRIILKRHTWSEVIIGSLIAGVVSGIYLFYNIQQIP